MSQVVVIQIEDWIARIAVDRVLDTMEVSPHTSVPKSLIAPAGERGYVRGTARHQDKSLSLLDLPQIFHRGEFVVDEDVYEVFVLLL